MTPPDPPQIGLNIKYKKLKPSLNNKLICNLNSEVNNFAV